MPEERGLYPKMRVAEQLAYLGEIHGLAPAAARAARSAPGSSASASPTVPRLRSRP